ncbi:hypothetical protein HAX54_043010 [Datura stramonium]|uniref:Uncharacterized protein n=1 Tax=Datura stramonium TaxID=4076 RepID=A0ABS8W0Q6_DATST|nr:hypothetical protein [Datura stramonium]
MIVKIQLAAEIYMHKDFTNVVIETDSTIARLIMIQEVWNATYVPREHNGHLKWKHPRTNTVGFLFEVRVDGSSLLYLQEQENKKLIEGCRVIFKDGTDLSLYSVDRVVYLGDDGDKYWEYFLSPSEL